MNNREATISNYAERVVEDADIKTLLAFAIETIIDNLDDYTDEEAFERIYTIYDWDMIVDGVNDESIN